jgi:hypothetical protein
MTLRLCPMTLKAACRYIEAHHRHSRPPHGALFAVGAMRGEDLCGVAVIGRPVARLLQDGYTCEVVRLCTQGEYNACSLLYGACRRAARALGYRRIVTYTLASEPGTSLRASGWTRVAEVKPTPWGGHVRGRPNKDLFGTVLRPEGEDKVRWECLLVTEK